MTEMNMKNVNEMVEKMVKETIEETVVIYNGMYMKYSEYKEMIEAERG